MLLSCVSLFAQEQDSTQRAFHASLNLIAAYRGDSVILRWAPETPGGWNEVKAAGCIVSRTEIDADGSFDPDGFQVLTVQPLAPWPLDKWESIAGQNSPDDYAKIAAQALYGESFAMSDGFIHQADEFITRYSFAMLAADLSPNTATALGLRFVDHHVQRGKVYLYRVESPVDSGRYTITPGVVSVNTESVHDIPPAVIGKVNEKEQVIELVWNRDFHNLHYSAYYIERSDDNGKSFKRLNKVPYIQPVPEKNPSISTITYLDSVHVNYKSFQYRIIGLTPFGETGPASPPVKAMGRDKTPPPVPANISARHAGGTKVRVVWEYPANTAIKGFLVGRGNSTRDFVPLVTEPLPPATREFIDNNASATASNFYVIAAVDTAGNASVSLAKYAMIIDSLPPAPPVKIAGNIDTLGHVTIHWPLGSEPDLKGYLVFFSNSADHQFTQLTNRVLLDTVFRDTITIKTLTKKIYYRVVAVDYNMNYSGFSEILELRRPDIIPPTAAVFDKYKLSEHGIELHWVASSSDDLAQSLLQRKEKEGQWKTISTYPGTNKISTFMDTTGLVHGQLYSYSVVSIDEDKLTKRSIPVVVKYNDLRQGKPVTALFASPKKPEETILVNWNYAVRGQYRFILYRAVNGSPFTSYKTLEGTTTTFNDTNVREGSRYEYSVGVVFSDGRKAPFGKVVEAVY